jgi:hypothetical protein
LGRYAVPQGALYQYQYGDMDAGRNSSRKLRPDLLSGTERRYLMPPVERYLYRYIIRRSAAYRFQTERLAIIFGDKSNFSKSWRKVVYKHFFHATSLLVWFGHKKLFMAGGVTFEMYVKKMQHKYNKTLQAVTANLTDHKDMIFKYKG